MTRTLVLFAKPPLPGKSKTRLAAEIGVAPAARVAETLLQATIALCELISEGTSERDLRLVLAYTERADWFARSLSADWRLVEQRGAELGECIENALADLGQAPQDRAILIGMDCPQMPPERVEEALEALEASDAVMGPCDDGGYYLLGVRGILPQGVLQGVPWGTCDALRDTASALEEANLGVSYLPRGYDIDTAGDLYRLIDEGSAASCSRLADLAWTLSGRAGSRPR